MDDALDRSAAVYELERRQVKQVLQNRTGLTVVRDVPPPACGPRAVLVRNAFSAISSGTERARVETSRKSLVGKARERPDLVRQVVERARREGISATRRAVQHKLSEETAVGYSSAGRVLEVGEAVRGFSPGDLVACGGAGYANHAEIVSVPPNLCARVPEGVPLEVAALTTIAAIALHGIRLADIEVGDRVGVVGCGLVGQIACRLLRAAGATVFALDVDSARVEQVRASGAAFASDVGPGAGEAVLRASGGLGLDAVLVTAAAPSNDPLLLAAAIARDRGAIVLVGAVPVEIPRAPLYEKELSFRVSRSYGPGRYDVEYEEHGIDYPIGYVRWTEQRNMECVLELQAAGAIDLRDLVEVQPASRAADAYARLVGPAEQRPRGAIALSYDEGPGPISSASRRNVAALATDQTDRPPTAVSKAPVRVGLIGPGNFALGVLVPAIVAAGGVLETVGGGSGRSAEAAARTRGFKRFSESAEALIEDDAVDAVVIATHHGAHASLAKRALAAGKHVFCEKPLALSTRELDEVLETVASSQGILAVGFNRRFSPFLRETREFMEPATAPIVAMYRVSAGPISQEHWVHDLERGGGRILGEVCHFVDSLAFVAGTPITDVYGAGYGQPETPLQARDNIAITLTFANDSVANIVYVAEGSRRVAKERVEVFGGSRTAILDDYRSLELFDANNSIRRRKRAQDKGHKEEIRAFLAAVSEGEPPVPISEVANVSLATLAAVESLRTGSAVRIDAPSSSVARA
jgi:predicted dehydrogenase/threonine dehydrogenase-like Zn-dependent dehydrogenase